MRKLKMKNERGAISTLVASTIFAYMAILLGTFLTITILRQSQYKSNIRIQEIYGEDVQQVDDVYRSIMNVNSVAMIGTKTYTSLETALNDVEEGLEQTTIIIIKDAESNITIPETKNIKINLEGHILKGNIINNGTLEIAGKGTLEAHWGNIVSGAKAIVDNYGTLVIQGERIVTTSVFNEIDSTAQISNSEITRIDNWGDLEIKDSVVTTTINNAKKITANALTLGTDDNIDFNYSVEVDLGFENIYLEMNNCTVLEAVNTENSSFFTIHGDAYFNNCNFYDTNLEAYYYETYDNTVEINDSLITSNTGAILATIATNCKITNTEFIVPESIEFAINHCKGTLEFKNCKVNSGILAYPLQTGFDVVLKINDSNIETKSTFNAISTSAETYIENSEIKAQSGAGINNMGTCKITGGTITSQQGNGIVNYGELEISGDIEIYNTDSIAIASLTPEYIGGTVGNINNITSTVKITGGTIKANSGQAIFAYEGCRTEISGGNISSGNEFGILSGGVLVITGGTITNTNSSYYAVCNYGGTATVSGATIVGLTYGI